VSLEGVSLHEIRVGLLPTSCCEKWGELTTAVRVPVSEGAGSEVDKGMTSDEPPVKSGVVGESTGPKVEGEKGRVSDGASGKG
jgi:hypothetical protein